MKCNIAVLRGDGIGPEVTDQAVKILEKVGTLYGHEFKQTDVLGGGAAIEATGEPLPAETIKVCQVSDAVLFGSVGDPKWDELPPQKRPEQAVLGLRKALGLYANLRPAIVFDELRDASPLKQEIIAGGLDILIVRELTGGVYFGPRGTAEGPSSGADPVADQKADDGIDSASTSKEKTSGPEEDLLRILSENSRQAGHRGGFAFDVEQYAESEIRRIAITAFELARKRNGNLVSVDKANVLDSSRLWRKIVKETAQSYPDIRLSHLYVDNAAMQLIRNPRQFDVVVTGNLFGDILSDEASQITGSIGMLPSASLAEGSFGLYEPIHGSAPDIAGQDKANPIAAILSVAMLLRYSLSLGKEADAVESAVRAFLKEGYRTPDLYGESGEGTRCVGTQKAGALIEGLLR